MTEAEQLATLQQAAEKRAQAEIVAGLSPCHSRREFDSERGLFFCAHPQIQIRGSIVDTWVCRSCSFPSQPPPAEFRRHPDVLEVDRAGPCLFLGSQVGTRECPSCRGSVQLKVYACQHPEHDEITLQDCNVCWDYERRLKPGTVREWAVGVTTAPRSQPTLARSLASLVAAGWPQARLFAEPGSLIPPEFQHWPTTWRDATLGAWPNWFLAASELYQRQPHAHAYLLLQDDVLYCGNLRSYLEKILWPQERLGVVSLYCSIPSEEKQGCFPIEFQGGIPGALACVFPGAALRSFLAHPATLAHRRHHPLNGLRHIDAVIGNWAAARAMPAILHAPSLTQHIGETTTIGDERQDQRRRFAPSFPGENFDALSLFRSEMQE